MCLYPGIYTPGIPAGYLSHEVEYLGNKSPPSNYGRDITDNAYIMNLNSCGGYIDGDGTPWYYDSTVNKLVSFTRSSQRKMHHCLYHHMENKWYVELHLY